MTTVRVAFSKNGKIRFTSHRDVARMWERALRRAQVPMVYSEGFNPRPRVSFGLALPTGYESDAEYIDVRIADEQAEYGPLDQFSEVLNPVLPGGLAVTGWTILENKPPSLQEAVTSCQWDITLMEATIEDSEAWVRRMLAADSIVVERERKGKPVIDDLRPGVLALNVVTDLDAGGRTHLHAELASKPRSLRPAELLTAIEPALEPLTVRRTKQLIDRDGARFEPLEDRGIGAAPEAQTTESAR